MSSTLLFSLAGVLLFVLGIGGVLLRASLLHKVLAFNVAGSGLFLLFIAQGYRGPALPPDPLPHALVLTGIVVAVSTTALALVLIVRLARKEPE